MLLIMYICAVFFQLKLFWEPPFWHPHLICVAHPLIETCRCWWDRVILNWICSLAQVFQKGVVSTAQAGDYAGNGDWAGGWSWTGFVPWPKFSRKVWSAQPRLEIMQGMGTEPEGQLDLSAQESTCKNLLIHYSWFCENMCKYPRVLVRVLRIGINSTCEGIQNSIKQ